MSGPGPAREGVQPHSPGRTSWCHYLPRTLCTRAASHAHRVSLRRPGATRGQCLQNLLLSVGWVFVSLPVLPWFVLSSLVLPFPWALLWCLLSFLSSGQVPQKPEVLVTARVWAVPGPRCAVPALLGRAGSTQQCYRLAQAGSALPVSSAGSAAARSSPPGPCAQLCPCRRLRVCLGHGLGSTKPNCIIGRINANRYFSNCNFACVVFFFWLSFVPLAAPVSCLGLGALCCRVGTCLAPSPSALSCWWSIRAQYPVLATEPGCSLQGKGQAGASQLYPGPG